MAGKKKANVWQGNIECPHCNQDVHIEVSRKRTNPVESPIYEYDQVVEPLTTVMNFEEPKKETEE